MAFLGQVVFYADAKRYGFLRVYEGPAEPHVGDADVFVHLSDVMPHDRAGAPARLHRGEWVRFDVEMREMGEMGIRPRAQMVARVVPSA